MPKARPPITPEREPPQQIHVEMVTCSQCGKAYGSIIVDNPAPEVPRYPAMVGHPVCSSCWPAIKYTYLTQGPAAALAQLQP